MRFVNSKSSPFNTYLHLPRKEKEKRGVLNFLSYKTTTKSATFLFLSDPSPIIALCSKSNGRCDIKAEKREELESKSSHKSDIWLPAASKKWGEIYWKYIFQTLEAIFPYKGVFVTKVVKANIIAFIKTKILRPVLSVTNPPFQKCQPLLHSAVSFIMVSIGYQRQCRSWEVCN